MVEGLRRAGREPTRERLVSALESLSDYDVGGFTVTYSPAHRSRRRLTDPSARRRIGTRRIARSSVIIATRCIRPPAFIPAPPCHAPMLPGRCAGCSRTATRRSCGAASDDAPAIPTLADLPRAGIDGDRHYLGELEGVPCVAMTLADEPRAAGGFAPAGLRALFFRIPDAMLALAGRASQIVEWDRTHRYCGRCATPTRDKARRTREGMSQVRATSRGRACRRR